jgi:hypothetical protein
LSLWQELEVLQKKKSELDGQLLSLGKKEKTLEERMKIVEEGLGLQEMRAHKLEVQLKDKHEEIGNLESRIAGMEKILKKPVKEPVEEEPIKEEPLKEPAKEESVKEEPAKIEPLKEPMKDETVKEEPTKEETAKEEPAKEPAKEEPEKQPIEVTVQTAVSGSQQQQKEEKKHKRWL